MAKRRTSCCGSPALSRSFSSCQIGLIMSATGRSGFGNASAGTPAPGVASCAKPDIANAAVSTTAIVTRIVPATRNIKVCQLLPECPVMTVLGRTEPLERRSRISRTLNPGYVASLDACPRRRILEHRVHRRLAGKAKLVPARHDLLVSRFRQFGALGKILDVPVVHAGVDQGLGSPGADFRRIEARIEEC